MKTFTIHYRLDLPYFVQSDRLIVWLDDNQIEYKLVYDNNVFDHFIIGVDILDDEDATLFALINKQYIGNLNEISIKLR